MLLTICLYDFFFKDTATTEIYTYLHTRSLHVALPISRDDKLMSPVGMWREWFMAPTQRCLIPFTAFAEAEGAAGAMTKTWIRVADQPLAAWAGLWRPTDEWGDCYTGVMVDATAELLDRKSTRLNSSH